MFTQRLTVLQQALLHDLGGDTAKFKSRCNTSHQIQVLWVFVQRHPRPLSLLPLIESGLPS